MNHPLIPEKRRAGRRRLMIGCSLVTLALVAAACGGGNSSSGENKAAGSSTELVNTSPPATGAIDNLTWDLPSGEPTSLDYAKAADYSPDTVVSNLCDSLLRLNPDFSYSPNLAKSWKYSPDHLALTYTLRDDVKFWDGKPMTSEDVAYSLNRTADPNTSFNATFFSRVKSITADGSTHVVVKFKTPDELFNKEMSTVSGAVSEKAFTEQAGKSYGTAQGGVMCSGPFELDKWTPGQSITMSANPDYWNNKLVPRAKKVTLSFITDTGNLVQALKSGEMNGTFEAPEAALPALESDPNGTVYQGPSLAIFELVANATPAGKDAKVRQALRMIIDRPALVEAVLHNAAEPNYTLLPKTSWDPTATEIYQKALDSLDVPKEPDPDGAKQALAGSPNTSITIGLLAGDQTEINTATLIQQEAEQIGLKVTLKQLQPIQFGNAFYDPNARKGLDFIVTKGFLDIADPLDYMGLFIYPDSLFNWIGLDYGKGKNLINKAYGTFDDKKRAEYITQAQAIYEKGNAAIPIAAFHETSFMNNKISGAPTSFAYIMSPSLATVGAK
jgi:peptide/nickel transport system substrate-binding protein